MKSKQGIYVLVVIALPQTYYTTLYIKYINLWSLLPVCHEGVPIILKNKKGPTTIYLYGHPYVTKWVASVHQCLRDPG